jgi:hypothetical protein
MRASPMWDSAVLERLGHSDVGGARERQGALEEGGIVDFEVNSLDTLNPSSPIRQIKPEFGLKFLHETFFSIV